MTLVAERLVDGRHPGREARVDERAARADDLRATVVCAAPATALVGATAASGERGEQRDDPLFGFIDWSLLSWLRFIAPSLLPRRERGGLRVRDEVVTKWSVPRRRRRARSPSGTRFAG